MLRLPLSAIRTDLLLPSPPLYRSSINRHSAMHVAGRVGLVADRQHPQPDRAAAGYRPFDGVADAQAEQGAANGGQDRDLVVAAVGAGRIDQGHLALVAAGRSEEHTSELQSLMRISYAVFCLKKKKENYQRYQLHL